jgi:hypothetical protein
MANLLYRLKNIKSIDDAILVLKPILPLSVLQKQSLSDTSAYHHYILF